MDNSSPVFHWAKNFSEKFDLNNFENILDVGSRNGIMSAYLSKKYKDKNFIAIDSCDCKIKQAKNYQYSNLEFEHIDILSLPYVSEFDAVVSFSCLHWIKNKKLALENMCRALKPGGKIFLQFFVLHGRPKNDRFFYQHAQSPKWKHYFKKFFPDYYEISLTDLYVLLQNCGLMIHKIEFSHYRSLFNHTEDLSEWFGTWSSHQKYLPLKKQECFLNEVAKNYTNYYQHDSESSFPYYEYMLEVICEKPIDHDELNTLNPYQYGPICFTQKEAFVLKHFLQGKTAKEISSLSTVTAKTIEFHLAKIKEKLNCHRRSEVVSAAFSYGFINLIYDKNRS